MTQKDISYFKDSLYSELQSILQYWRHETIDRERGGFYGRIDHYNTVHATHPKGIILNTRILWTFAKANNFYECSTYEKECVRSFDYLWNNFRDSKNGGVFWEVDCWGRPTHKRKQIYAQAFCIYALSEYYKYCKLKKVLDWAWELYGLLEEKALDSKFGGYFEAFGTTWETIGNVRLSSKDLNSPKTTNTQLHILEAYTNLYEVTRDNGVRGSLGELMQLFHNTMFGKEHHLKLFFSRKWSEQSTEISFGHDIEAAWLLIHAARTTNLKGFVKTFEIKGQQIVDAFIKEALDTEFAVLYSKDRVTQKVDMDRHWWPQIEAMVGLIHIWKITNDTTYLDICGKIWHYVRRYIIDQIHGEWFFRVDADGKPYTGENKVGPWKCPYHNSRGLIEILGCLE